jgi:hypothetical protein
MRGAAFAGSGQAIGQPLDDAFQLFFHPETLPHPGG